MRLFTIHAAILVSFVFFSATVNADGYGNYSHHYSNSYRLPCVRPSGNTYVYAERLGDRYYDGGYYQPSYEYYQPSYRYLPVPTRTHVSVRVESNGFYFEANVNDVYRPYERSYQYKWHERYEYRGNRCR